MAGFILKRLLQAIFVVLAVTLIVSFAIRLSGDPAVMLMGGGGSVTEQDLQNIRQALGLERPFYVQYLGFLEGILTGDFGKSFMGGTPVSAAHRQRAAGNAAAGLRFAHHIDHPLRAARHLRGRESRPLAGSGRSASCRWSACPSRISGSPS